MYNRQLDAFIAVAERGSISAAAKACYVSQPALTQQIGLLEGRLGCKLFNRTNRGVTLTEAGSYLLERARAVVRYSDETLRELGKIVGHSQTRVTIFADIMVHAFLSPIVAEYDRRHPDARANLLPDRGVFPTVEVASGNADLCVMCDGKTIRASGLVFVPLFVDEECCMFSQDSELARLDAVGLDDLAGYSVLLPPQGYCDSSDAIRKHLAARHDVRISPLDALGDSVRAQVLTLDQTLVSLQLNHHMHGFPGLVMRPFNGYGKASVGLAVRPNPSPAVEEFVAIARAYAGLDAPALDEAAVLTPSRNEAGVPIVPADWDDPEDAIYDELYGELDTNA